MVKGCSKRVIVLKSPNSELIDEAYFILKDRAHMPCMKRDFELVDEANRIVSESLLVSKKQDKLRDFPRKKLIKRSFLFGAGTGVLVTSLAVLLLKVI